MAPIINIQDEFAELQNELTSLGAAFSNTIRNAIANASDAVKKDIIQQAGKSLTSSFSQLATLSDTFSKNASKINRGLLDSKGLSEQILNLEDQKLELIRRIEAARAEGIPINEALSDNTLQNINDQTRLLESQKAITDSVEKQVGLVGKLAGAMGAIPGLNKIINAKELEAELRKAAVQLDENGNLVKTGIGKFDMMAIAAKTVGKQFATAMFDPAVIVGKIVEQFFAINKASVELRRLTGDTAESFGDFSTGAAGAVQILETAAELTKQTGLNAQMAFSGDVVAQAASLKVEMGLAADEAGGIAVMAQTSGQSVDGMVESIVASTSAFNGANRSAVSQGVVLRDVAKTSAAIKASLGSNPKALADAASQARLLGTDLNGLNTMAASLLEFESSIEAELEAQLLTGKNINLSKARELALNDDLIGVGKEIFKNTVDINEFGEMGRLGQEAYAKSLGMTRDQLAQIAYQTALNNGMTSEAAAAAANVNAEDMKRVTAMENFTLAINKVMSFFAPLLEGLSNFMSIPWLGPITVGLVVVGGALMLLMSQVAAITTAFGAKTATILVNNAALGTNTGLLIAEGNAQIFAATTAGPAAGGFSAMGAALGAFGTAATTAIGPLLAIAAVAAGIGIAFAGIGYALMQVPAILNLITAEKATGMILLGQAFGGLALGLAAIAVSGLAALPVLLGLQKLGVLGGGIAVQAAASPGAAAITGTQKPVESPQAPAASLSLDPLVTEIKLMKEEMTSLMKQFITKELVVKIDSYAVMQAGQISGVK